MAVGERMQCGRAVLLFLPPLAMTVTVPARMSKSSVASQMEIDADHNQAPRLWYTCLALTQPPHVIDCSLNDSAVITCV